MYVAMSWYCYTKCMLLWVDIVILNVCCYEFDIVILNVCYYDLILLY